MITQDRVKKITLQIVEDTKSKHSPEKIMLYGSFAYGVQDENSDIDLLIVKECSERPLDRMTLIHRIVDIRDSSYPAFSPIVFTPDETKQRLEIGDQFIQEILTRGEVLYAW